MIEDISAFESVVSGLQLVGGCKQRSHALRDALKDGVTSAPAPSATVREGFINGEEGTDPHYWVEVKGIDFPVASSEEDTVILDPSLRQFTQENYQQDLVGTWLPEAAGADEIAVITASDPLQEKYW